MARTPSCCKEVELNRGSWTAQEDMILSNYIKTHGENRWRSLPKKAGLNRCGKSCRLRWLNYLRPDIKRGNISHDEEELIIRMHRLLGNRWSLIAGRLPGRTDNEIKNYWNTHLSKKPTMSFPNSKSHTPVRKSRSFGSKQQSLSSDSSTRDKAALSIDSSKPRDRQVSSAVLAETPSVAGEQVVDVSKSWTQLLEDSLMADDLPIDNTGLKNDCNFEPSSTQVEPCSTSSRDLVVPELVQLNDSYNPLVCNSLPIPLIDFGLENFSVESLLQPMAYHLQDICRPVQNSQKFNCDNVNHPNFLAMAAEEGMSEIYNTTLHQQQSDWIRQQQFTVKQLSQLELDPLDKFFDYDENWQDEVVSTLTKTHEEENGDIIVDISN